MKPKNILQSATIAITVIILCFHVSSAQNSFPTPTGACELDATGVGASSGGELRLLELNVNGNNYVGLKAPDLIGGNQVYTFPNGFPSGSGKVLSSDNSGNLTWTKRAKTDLGNLDATTAINANLVPDADNLFNLGSPAIAWHNAYFKGSLGIGTTAPSTKLQIIGGSDASLAGIGFMQLGATTGSNLVLDDNEIIQRNNGSAGTLFLQNDGGNLNVSAGGLFVNDNSFTGINTTVPAVELHLFHGVGSGNTNGLRIENNGANTNDWTLYTQNSSGNFELYFNGLFRGSFDNVSGAYSSVSDQRLKTDIVEAPGLIDKVMQLDVKKYHFLSNAPTDLMQFGMIAQEVEKIFPEIVNPPSGGDGAQYYTMNYSALGVIAIKAIQELENQVAEKNKEIAAQQEQIQQLSDRVTGLESGAVNPVSTHGTARFSMTAEDAQPVLGQNIPNPFDNSTLIPFRLPKDCKDASLRITETTTGRILKVIPLVCGDTQISIDAAQLSSGTYTYSLYADGKLIDTKHMELLK